MNCEEFNASMEIVVSALKDKGYDPYDQIYGYLHAGSPIYITQHNNAREIIQTLDKTALKNYIEKM